jgi:4-amino-4-deoxy-L-arabinose transferase-like glycosyltransferase
VKQQRESPWPSRFAITACCLSFLVGQLFIPLLGLQGDEELFGSAFVGPPEGDWYLHAGIPIEYDNYLGALKAWLYRPIIAVFGTGVWAQREPVLLATTVSIWLFFLLLRRMAGNRAAVIGIGLLASDAMYLLTSCYDWGPVALQHLLLIGGMLLAVRFYQDGGWRSLAGGCFLFGLAMWDKAIAVWMLSGMGVAALAVYWGPVRRAVTIRRVAVATAAFLLGALPLVVYNVDTRLGTVTGHAYTSAGWPTRARSYSLSHLLGKAHVLVETALGSQLFGGMVEEDGENAQPAAPGNILEKASLGLSEIAHRPRVSLLLPAFLLALALAAKAPGRDRRIVVFCLVALAVQWAQMAIAVSAGVGAHHTILLWPLPQVVIGVSFAVASRRLGRAAVPALAGALALVMAAGALQINEYYRMAWRNGGTVFWSNAIFRLSSYMEGTRAERVHCTDDYICQSLRVLNRGALPLDDLLVTNEPGYAGWSVFTTDGGYRPTAADPQNPESPGMKLIEAAASRPSDLFLGHAKAWEIDTSEGLLELASAAGYRREVLATIPDSFGRPVFEAYRFVRK